MVIILVSFLSRAVITVVFMLSFLTKISNMNSFNDAIIRFKLIPSWASQTITGVIIAFELLVIITMIMGGWVISWGYLFASLLLTIFSIALGLTLLRGIDTSCNCFGLSDDKISFYDIARNIGFISISIVGYSTSLVLPRNNLDPTTLSLLVVIAIVIVVVWINLKHMIKFLLDS